MSRAKSTTEEDTTKSAPVPGLFEYYPLWRWAVLSLGVGWSVRHMAESVADYAYRQGVSAERRRKLFNETYNTSFGEPTPEYVPEPYCNALGTPGCKLAYERGQAGVAPEACPPSEPCFYAHHAPQSD